MPIKTKMQSTLPEYTTKSTSTHHINKIQSKYDYILLSKVVLLPLYSHFDQSKSGAIQYSQQYRILNCQKWMNRVGLEYQFKGGETVDEKCPLSMIYNNGFVKFKNAVVLTRLQWTGRA